MKHLLLLSIVTTLFAIETNARERKYTDPLQQKTKLLKKSERQLRTGTILLISSPILIAIPMVVGPGIRKGGDATMGIIYGAIGAGFLAFPASIAFFISSTSVKKKALRLGIGNKNVPVISGQNLRMQTLPALTLKLSL